jgi:hypothetical protein
MLLGKECCGLGDVKGATKVVEVRQDGGIEALTHVLMYICVHSPGQQRERCCSFDAANACRANLEVILPRYMGGVMLLPPQSIQERAPRIWAVVADVQWFLFPLQMPAEGTSGAQSVRVR